MAHKEDVNEDAEISRLRAIVQQWRAEAARKGMPLRLPITPFLLRNIWMAALILFTILTFSTFFISTVTQVWHSFLQKMVTFMFLGNCLYQSCWHLLGSGYVGSIRYHYGGATTSLNQQLKC